MKLRPDGEGSTWRVSVQRGLPLLAVVSLVGLLLFQAFAFFDRLTLSLEARVILQPWLLQQGFVLYEEIADLHSPLMPLTLAGLRYLIPDGFQLAKLALVALLSLSTLLTFLAARRSAGWLAGLWAAWFFVVFSPTFGFGKLWHESFLTPIYAFLLLWPDPGTSRRSDISLLFLGFVGGIALLVKQHSVVVVLSLLAWSVLANRHFRRSHREVFREIALIGLGVILPVLVFIVYQYIRAGTLSGMLYWTIGFALTSDYGSLAARGPSMNQIYKTIGCSLLIFPALFTLIDLKRRGDGMWLRFGWGCLLLVGSSVTIFPRFEFFHLQAALPIIAWLSSLTIARAWRSSAAGRPFVAGTALAMSVFWLIWAGAAYRPATGAGQSKRIAWYSNLERLAGDLEKHIRKADSMYVFPDDELMANLYYLMRYLPPRFWIFHYPWNMSKPLKGRVLSILKNEPPKWVIYLPGRWGIERTAPEVVGYLQTYYRQVAEFQMAQRPVLLLRRLE